MIRTPISLASLALALAASPVGAHEPVQTARADAIAEAVSQDRLRGDIDSLVGFGTRHTLSEQDDAARGIGAARRWAEREFLKAGEACGGCLTVMTPEKMISGNRIDTPVRLVNVLGIQRGTERPDEVVVVSAHIDSRASDVMDWRSEAPGANDNGSGTALVIEAARVLSRHRFPTTIVFAVLSGEEQGLYGGKLLAETAQQQGWTVKAVLNNDIVGGSRGSDGMRDEGHVRVFSESFRGDATDDHLSALRRQGFSNDTPSRNLSRWIAALAEDDADAGLTVRQVWRADRMGRGGDQLPMQAAGFPAVRFSVAVEDYEHQHQDLRVEDGITYGDTVDEMDFDYLERVTRLNVRVLSELARTPMPPVAQADVAVRTSTGLSWQAAPGAQGYRIWKRRSDEARWQPVRTVPASETSAELEGLRGDDWAVGVSAIANGVDSPVAAAVPGGGFYPLD